jgi:peroxiredoxin
MTRFVTAAVLAFATARVEAAPLKVGSPAPDFSGLQGTDGKAHALADYKDKDVLVVCITTNHCPVAIAYQDRINEFARKYAGPDSKVGFIAINVNKSEEDSLPKMKERSKEKGFVFPYAFDPSQRIARELGASRTPEFFVFDKDRKLVYTGALDDNMKEERASKHYLADAVESALKGETPKTPTTAAVGCAIMYERGSR